MARSSGQGMGKSQVPPLRCASVEMTKGRVVMARSSGQGMGKPQVPPLRCAPIGMTKERGHASRSATTLPGSTALPFVISTGAQRSGEISVWMLLLGDVFLAERSVAQGLRFLLPGSQTSSESLVHSDPLERLC
jgi:hypothetical protein